MSIKKKKILVKDVWSSIPATCQFDTVRVVLRKIDHVIREDMSLRTDRVQIFISYTEIRDRRVSIEMYDN